MTHNSSEYNFAYNEGGLLKFVWKNMFSNNSQSSNKNGSDGRSYQGQQQHQYHQQQYGIGSSAWNNQYQNQGTDFNQRGKG